MRRSLPTAVLVLLLTLAATAAQASETRVPSFASRLWSLLNFAWSGNGCGLDPDGRCLPEEPADAPDNGCRADPDGRCLPEQDSLTSDNGCGLDPNGACLI